MLYDNDKRDINFFLIPDIDFPSKSKNTRMRTHTSTSTDARARTHTPTRSHVRVLYMENECQNIAYTISHANIEKNIKEKLVEKSVRYWMSNRKT